MEKRLRNRWGRRWLITWVTLLWCSLMASYVIVYGKADDRLRETALEGIFLLAGSVVGAHLGFATWDDRHARLMMRRRRPIPEQEPEAISDNQEG